MSETESNDDGGQSAGPDVARTLPDVTVCRAKPAGFGDYVSCLVVVPNECIYALAFAEGHLCLHPERKLIAQRTRASLQ
jgi:hypothetical protein